MKARLSREFDLAAAAILCAAAAWFAFLSVQDGRMRPMFDAFAYWTILGVAVLWAWIFFQNGAAFAAGARRDLRGAAVSLMLTAWIFSSGADFRILNDETNLASQAAALFRHRSPHVILESAFIGGKLQPLAFSFPARPLMFPFLTHLVHGVSGFRLENAFAVNFAALFALLWTVHAYVRARAGSWFAAAAAVALCAQPLIPLSAASGGYDLLSVLMMFAGFVFLERFLTLNDAPSWRMLWIHLAALAHVRHESAMYLALVTAVLALCGRLRPRHFEPVSLFALTPLLLLTVVWQRLLIPQTMPGFFQNGPDIPVFSAAHFVRNGAAFARSFADFSMALPFAGLLNLAGAAFWIYAAAETHFFGRGRAERERRTAGLAALVCLGALWTLVTSIHFGHPAMRVSARYFLPFCFVLTLGAVWAAARIRIPGRRPLALALAAAALLFYRPAAADPASKPGGTFTHHYRFVRHVLAEQPDADKSLLVSSAPKRFAFERPSIGFRTARKNAERLWQERTAGVYADIYVVQNIKNGSPDPREKAFDAFRLVRVAESNFGRGRVMRISRVEEASEKRRMPNV